MNVWCLPQRKKWQRTTCCVQRGCHSNQWVTSLKEGVCGGRKLRNSSISRESSQENKKEAAGKDREAATSATGEVSLAPSYSNCSGGLGFEHWSGCGWWKGWSKGIKLPKAPKYACVNLSVQPSHIKYLCSAGVRGREDSLVQAFAVRQAGRLRWAFNEPAQSFAKGCLCSSSVTN